VQSSFPLATDTVHTSANVTTQVAPSPVSGHNAATATFTDNTNTPGWFIVKWTDNAGHFTNCASGPIQFGGNNT
jgi:hypothetical protein